MTKEKEILQYLKKNKLILATAESCTAGKIINLLAKIPDSGECLDAGFIVYSKESKKRLLNVKQKTIDKYNLTSEEVAYEMCLGALKNSYANLAIATTGIAGTEPKDGIEPGTICFAWGFKNKKQIKIYTHTHQFTGTQNEVINKASKYALNKIPYYHRLNA